LGLVTEYPSGFILLCVLLAAGYAVILYYRDVRKGPKTLVLWTMFALRLLSVFFISLLILNPLIKQSEKLIEKPIVIIGVDNSRSMVLAGDSDYYRIRFPAQINALIDELKKKCEVKVYSLSDKLQTGFDASYNGTQTDISAFFNEVTTRYANRNAAALILASDGIYNAGSDPYYSAQKISFPIYTIAAGDTNLKRDLNIRQVIVNKTAYKGDKFPVEILVEMNKCAGLTSKLTLSHGTNVIDTREIKSTNDRSMQKVGFILDARETGVTKYSLRLNELESEVSYQNNRFDFFVEVLDTRQKIALIYASPHPDITAIQKALEGSSHFEIDNLHTDSLPQSLDKYDLLILNQLPSITNIFTLSSVMKAKGSLLFIIGAQTDFNSFNNLKTGLIINSPKNSVSDAQAIVNNDFSLFTLPNRDKALFEEFPPLQSPFAQYQFSPLAEILFYQKIGTVTTQNPLILFTRLSEKKIGFIAGENIWRWRINNFIQQSNFEAFDLLIDKTAQYLSTKDDKSFFRIDFKNKITENEPVEMNASLYNATYELINDPEVNIIITDAAGKIYPFVFSKTAKSYYLNAGLFPVGEYSFKATTRVGSTPYLKKGKFFIEQVNIESSNLVADHLILDRIASTHDGIMIEKDSIATLADKITDRQDIRSVSIIQQRMTDLIGNPWIFVLIITLLTAEWVIRKREGK